MCWYGDCGGCLFGVGGGIVVGCIYGVVGCCDVVGCLGG